MAEDMSAPHSPLSPPKDSSGFNLPPASTANDSRRIRPGTKAADMNEGPPLVDISEIDSAFQLTEHLKALHYNYTNPPDVPTSQPITRAVAATLASAPPHTDRSLWLYELCRFLVQKINIIMVSLFADNPPCSAQTCPEMRASEWQYLCAVHDPPKSCCAIDYCCHTLDWAANTLTSTKHFPSRLALGSEGAGGVTRPHQERQLTNIFRRVYRIFAHAWFQHRDVFWRVEGRTGLYVLFKTVCDSYALIPEDNYTIPPEAEGLETAQDEGMASDEEFSRRQSASPYQRRPNEHDSKNRPDAGAVTARKHRSAPSRSGSSIAPVMEENEDEDNAQAGDREYLPSSMPPSMAVPPIPSHKPSVEYIGNLSDLPRSGNEDAPPEPTPTSEALASRSGGSLGISPTSPHAMTSADLEGARTESENRSESSPIDEHLEQVAEEESVAKAALTKAEGVQATTTEAAEPTDASKSVED